MMVKISRFRPETIKNNPKRSQTKNLLVEFAKMIIN